MIWTYLLNFIFGLLSVLFSWLPRVNTLPTINGFNVDGALLTMASYFHYFVQVFPPFATLFYALLFWYSYKVTMMILRFTRIIR